MSMQDNDPNRSNREICIVTTVNEYLSQIGRNANHIQIAPWCTDGFE